MRHLWLLVGLLGLVVSGPVWAASYLDVFGMVHDPIQDWRGGDSAYSGNNLEPNANLEYAQLSYADLEDADLYGADLYGADLHDADLSNATLSYAELTDAFLSSANLTHADLSFATLDYAGIYSSESDFEYANLQNASLVGANFTKGVAHLSYINLSGADLEGASVYANLTGANLSLVNLTGAYLSNTDDFGWSGNGSIAGANLTQAILFSANLRELIDWDVADWTGAKYSLNAVDNSGNPIADTIFPDGMDQAWRDAAGMVAVPEPATALFLGLGLVGLAARRRV